jgi:hypothetical protein
MTVWLAVPKTAETAPPEREQTRGDLDPDRPSVAARGPLDPRRLDQPAADRQRPVEQDERQDRARRDGSEHALDLPRQLPLRQRRRCPGARATAALERAAPGGSCRRGSSAAGGELGRLPAGEAATTTAVHPGERKNAPAPDQRRREQDRSRDLDGQRRSDAQPRRARRPARTGPGAAGGRPREDPAGRRPDHRHALEPARPGAEGRSGDQVPERLAVSPGPGAVRAGSGRSPGRSCSSASWC